MLPTIILLLFFTSDQTAMEQSLCCCFIVLVELPCEHHRYSLVLFLILECQECRLNLACFCCRYYGWSYGNACWQCSERLCTLGYRDVAMDMSMSCHGLRLTIHLVVSGCTGPDAGSCCGVHMLAPLLQVQVFSCTDCAYILHHQYFNTSNFSL